MKRVVLIEDDADLRLMAEMELRRTGCEVFPAADGPTGLQLIQAHRPQVVLLDLMLPGLHGYAVCQQIRRDPSLSDVQIIVTSAKAYPVDIKKAKELGVDVYLTKPFEASELIEKVQAALYAGGPSILVKFWGTRGSIPTPGPSTQRYGGNTSCVEVRCGDSILMLDCGTGARELGLLLSREFQGRALDLHLFVSHTHWDHIQGFPFFAPAYVPGNRLNIYSLRGSDKSLEKVFTGQMDASYFPVSLADLQAQVGFVELEGVVKVGALEVSHMYLNHPGLAIGFRLKAGKKTLVYVTDHESYCRMLGDNEHNRKKDQEVAEFARSADLYIRDAQYSDEEYDSKRGWGHSTRSDALESAHQANVRQLALFHHDPSHDDDSIDRSLAECHQYMKQRGMEFSCFAAADYLQVTL